MSTLDAMKLFGTIVLPLTGGRFKYNVTFGFCSDSFCGFNPTTAREFGCRVLDLKEQGVGEEEAMAVADVRIPLLKFLNYSCQKSWIEIDFL